MLLSQTVFVLTGSVISSALAFGPVARLFTQQIYLAIEATIDRRGILLSISHPPISRYIRFWYII